VTGKTSRWPRRLLVSDVATAEAKILDRFRGIEAALHDLRPEQFALATAPERAGDRMSFDVHRNRVAVLLINLYHLKDDARGLARARGLGKELVEELCRNKVAVDLCVKAGDTYKHGVGGRAGNNTVIGYEVLVCHQEGPEPQPTDAVANTLMLVVDNGGEQHQSDLLAAEALRDWAAFLEGTLRMTLPAWVKGWTPIAPAPGRSLYTGSLPPALLEHMKKTTARRT
jgi:hypothetical protein